MEGGHRGSLVLACLAVFMYDGGGVVIQSTFRKKALYLIDLLLQHWQQPTAVLICSAPHCAQGTPDIMSR